MTQTDGTELPRWAQQGVAVAPLSNEFVVGVASAPLLSPEQCADLRATLSEEGWLPGPARPGQAPHFEVQPLAAEAVEWVLPIIGHAVSLANNQHFRFELTGMLGFDPPGTSRLAAGVDDSELRSDISADHSTRKLVAVIPLDEGEGGVPEFPALGKQCNDGIGVMSAFPAYLTYRLRAAGGSGRLLLWSWVHGPHFR
jgi:hypothetical protein